MFSLLRVLTLFVFAAPLFAADYKPAPRIYPYLATEDGNLFMYGGRAPWSTVQDGGYYDFEKKSWTEIPKLPEKIENPALVVSKTQLLLIGGTNYSTVKSYGFIVDRQSGTVTPLPSVNGPISRDRMKAVLTEDQVLVWGGERWVATNTYDYPAGGIFDLRTKQWRSISTTEEPLRRSWHAQVWTGEELIVWGGSARINEKETVLQDGAIYNLASDTWRPITMKGAPNGRTLTSHVWTGTELLIWAGTEKSNNSGALNTGWLYNPKTDSWRGISTEGAPSPRAHAIAVWTGSKMLVWGGWNGTGFLTDPNDGALYDPATDKWEPISTQGAPSPRWGTVGIWNGTKLVLYGGAKGGIGGDGFKLYGEIYTYDPFKDVWAMY